MNPPRQLDWGVAEGVRGVLAGCGWMLSWCLRGVEGVEGCQHLADGALPEGKGGKLGLGTWAEGVGDVVLFRVGEGGEWMGARLGVP